MSSGPDRDGRAPSRRGRFEPHFVEHIASARLLHHTRRHRKGLGPFALDEATDRITLPPTPVAAFRHLGSPRRIGWWIALLFAIGASHFMVASALALAQGAGFTVAGARTQAWIYFVGSIFFTSAAWLQWLESLNYSLGARTGRFRFFGVRPRDLGWLAATTQLVGTLLFNQNTGAGLFDLETWQRIDLFVWTPDMVGSVCFLVASLLATAECLRGGRLVQPWSVSWWIVVANLLGSVAFQVSAIEAFVPPQGADPRLMGWSTAMTLVGAACFWVGAVLLIPELNEEIAEATEPAESS